MVEPRNPLDKEPAEGSRDIIEHELKRQQAAQNKAGGGAKDGDQSPAGTADQPSGGKKDQG